MRNPICIIVLVAVGGSSTAASAILAADWPTYRGNHQRTGTTEENLNFPLAEAWRYEPAQPHRQAWPEVGNNTEGFVHVSLIHFGVQNEGIPAPQEFYARNLQFDESPQPTMAHGLVFVGSSSDDTVRAFQAQTGKLSWSFTAGGPVRFAPELAGGRAYIVSDDGVQAATAAQAMLQAGFTVIGIELAGVIDIEMAAGDECLRPC